MRADYEAYLQYAYAQAVEGTGGVLVNRDGRQLKIEGYDLFTGPQYRAKKYASEELIEWWDKYPRKSLDQFERQWIEGELQCG